MTRPTGGVMVSGLADPGTEPAGKEIRVVKSVAELRQLASLREFLFGPRDDEYVLELAGFDGVVLSSWERRFEAHYFECGCGVGELFVGVGCLVSACVLFGWAGGLRGLTRAWGLECLAWLALAAVVGKACGLAIAYVRLRRLLEEIEGPHNTPCP